MMMYFFLAQTESSDVGDFLSQISGLLILTCAIGLLWMLLMALVMQRASERRRRTQQGLEPLPGIHIAAYQSLMKWLNPQSTSQRPPAQTPSRRAAPAMPAPDLGQLTGDLPTPDLSAMTGVPQGTRDEPAREVDLEQAFVLDEEDAREDDAETPAPDLEQAFTVDDEEEDEDAPDDAPRVETDTGAPLPPADAVELLRVWRDLSDGTLVVEIGGQRFESLADLRHAGLERRFLNVVRDLDSLSQRPRAVSAPPPESKPTAQPDSPDAPPPSLTPGSMLRQMTRVAMGQSPDPVEITPERSIADQIEDLLQERLSGAPEYQGRSIHVRPALDGGVRIEVDGQYFDGVGDVDDDDVRALLMDVVREWENRQ